MTHKKRKFSAYEKNHLLKHGFKADDFCNTNSPVEYITNSVNFFGRDFYVDTNVLIPRIETEELVELVLQKIDNNFKVLDLATGSGAIGLTLYLELRKRGISINLTLSDISPSALDVAKKNLHRFYDQDPIDIKIIESDLFNNFQQGQKFDIIVANLPYVPAERMPNLDESVKDFEPSLALNGGDNGLEIISRFLISAEMFLEKKGLIFLEIDETHSQQNFDEIVKTYDLPFEIKVLPDSFNCNRFAIVSMI